LKIFDWGWTTPDGRYFPVENYLSASPFAALRCDKSLQGPIEEKKLKIVNHQLAIVN